MNWKKKPKKRPKTNPFGGARLTPYPATNKPQKHTTMKKTFIILAMLAVAVSARANDNTTTYKREGTTFSKDTSKQTLAKSDTPTAYTWKDSKGNEYPIILHTYTRGEKAGRVTAYVIRTSAKTGNQYKYYLPEGEAIAKEILAETK